MKPLFSPLELIVRIPVILLFFWIVIRCIVDFDNRFDSLLFLLLGAAAWENILFILHRLGWVDVTKDWKRNNEEDKPTS